MAKYYFPLGSMPNIIFKNNGSNSMVLINLIGFCYLARLSIKNYRNK